MPERSHRLHSTGPARSAVSPRHRRDQSAEGLGAALTGGRGRWLIALSAFGAGVLAATFLAPPAPADVTVTTAATVTYTAASDGFARVVSNGLGVADAGGPWSVLGAPSAFSVAGGSARLQSVQPGVGVSARLDQLRVRDSTTTATVSLDRVATGGGMYVSLTARQVADYAYYGLKLRGLSNGSVTASLVLRTPTAETTLVTAPVAGMTLGSGAPLRARIDAYGSSPTVLRARVWRSGTLEPTSWMFSTTNSSAALQGAGGVGVVTYASASSTGTPPTTAFGGLSVAPLTASGTAPAPVAAPAPTTSTKPGAASTGVPDGTVLTPYYGDLVITTPGATYDRLDVHGFVKIQAPNVTIRRSIIRGGTATGNIGLVTNTTPTATNFVIEDSTLTPEHPSVWLDAIKGANYTARRIEATGTVDGAKIHGNNVRVERSWIHDTVYYASDPNQGGGPTHNDGVQILGGDNITITGNNISVPLAQNSAIQVTQNYAAVTRTTLTGNWLDGAGCTVNTNDIPRTSMTGVTLTNNRFGRNHRYIDCAVMSYPGVILTQSGNVWDDTGLPARLRLNG